MSTSRMLAQRLGQSLTTGVLLFASAAMAQVEPPVAITSNDFGFLRYNDSYSGFCHVAAVDDGYASFKCIPLSDAADDVMTLGGDDREKVEGYQYPMFGKQGVKQDTTYLHRLLLHANLRFDAVRFFVELGNENENGRLPKALPTDTDRLDLAQAFVDFNLSPSDGPLTVRIGREELLYGEGLLIGPRDAPNIREDWDGLRIIKQLPAGTIDFLAVRPVNNYSGVFDDSTSTTQALWGVYAALHPAFIAPLHVDLYALGTQNDALQLADGLAPDHRYSIGGRLYGTIGATDGVLELIGQDGSFGNRNVLAYAFHSELGYTLRHLPGNPHFSLRFDDLSGNRNRGSGTEGSFYPISPNLSYSTEASIEAASNLRQAGVVAGLTPLRDLTVSYEFEGLWRDSTQDAFYVAPQIPLFEPGRDNQRFTGTEQQLYASWRFTPFLSVKAALVRFTPGAFVSSSGGHAINYGMVAGSLRF